MQPVLRSPPAFEMDTGGDLFWRSWVTALSVATAAALLAWSFSHLAEGAPDAASAVQRWRQAALLALLVLPLVAGLAWRGSAPLALTLRWDGQGWFLLRPPLSEPQAVEVQVLADLGDWVMLRLYLVGDDWPLSRALAARLRPRYLRLSRAHAGARWPLLRAALFSAPAAQR